MADNKIVTVTNINWTLKNVTEDRLEQHENVASPPFRISVDGISYTWGLTIFVSDLTLTFYLHLKKNNEELDITAGIQIGSFQFQHFHLPLNSERVIHGRAGWRLELRLADLFNPASLCLDEQNQLVLNVMLKLEKAVKPQQAIAPRTNGENFAEFLDDDENSDAVFLCNDDVGVHVHRLLLIKKSDEFKEIFKEMNEKGTRTEKIWQVDSETMKQILKYAYTGIADHKDIETTKKIYEGAVAFEMLELQLQCVDSLINRIDLENVLDIFQVANELELEELTGKCLSFIMKFFHQLKPTQEWKDLSVELKEKVLTGFADDYSTIKLVTSL